MSDKSKLLFWIIIVLVLVLSACAKSEPEVKEESGAGNTSGIANPASVYCAGMGFELELRTSAEGSFGVCKFPDGSECEEWDFLSGRCGQEYSYCVQQGYVLEEGPNVGTCVFSDGSTCMEIDFFEGRCGP
jgi:putative hemolysin